MIKKVTAKYLTLFLIAIILPFHACELFAAQLPELTVSSPQQNLQSLQALEPLPDTRVFSIETVAQPKALSIEDLSAKQSAKGVTWFSGGEFLLRMDRQYLQQYNENDYATLREFFDKLIATSDAMSVVRYQLTATVTQQLPRKGGALLLEATDGDLHDKTQQGGHWVALVSPEEPTKLAAAAPGETLTLNVSLYKLLDAYGANLPGKQPAVKSIIRTFFSKNDEYLAQSSHEIVVNGGVQSFKWRPGEVSVIASWSMGIEYNVRGNKLRFTIAKRGKCSPTFVNVQSTDAIKATFSSKTDEEFFPGLAEKRATDKRIAEAKKALEKKEAQDKQREKYAAAKAEADAKKAKIIEANRPRERKWRAVAIWVVILTLVAPLIHLYAHLRPLHPAWKIRPVNTSSEVKNVISILWLGFFLNAALIAFSNPDPEGRLFQAWMTAGLGGVIAMLFSPWARKSNVFTMTERERLEMAVDDAVHRATGQVNGGGLLWMALRLIVFPVVVGGIFCPVVWLYATTRVTFNGLSLIKNRVPADWQPDEDQSEYAEQQYEDTRPE